MVFHFDLHHLLLIGQSQGHRSPWGGILIGVFDQIKQNLSQTVWVSSAEHVPSTKVLG